MRRANEFPQRILIYSPPLVLFVYFILAILFNIYKNTDPPEEGFLPEGAVTFTGVTEIV